MDVWIELDDEDDPHDNADMLRIWDSYRRCEPDPALIVRALRIIRTEHPDLYHRVFAEQYPPGALLQSKTFMAGDGHRSVAIEALVEPPPPA